MSGWKKGTRESSSTSSLATPRFDDRVGDVTLAILHLCASAFVCYATQPLNLLQMRRRRHTTRLHQPASVSSPFSGCVE